MKEDIELLTVLIEKYDERCGSNKLASPIELLRPLMKKNGLQAFALVNLL